MPSSLLRRPAILTALLGIAAPLLAGPSLAAAAAACTARPLPLNGVFVSAAQTADGDLLIADHNQRRLLEVDLPNGSWGAVNGTTGEFIETIRPISVHRIGEEVWLERQNPRGVVSLDRELRRRESPPRPLLASFEPDAPAQGEQMRVLWMYQPISESEVAACGTLFPAGTDAHAGRSELRTAFVRYSLDAPGDYREVHAFHPDQLAGLACRLKFPLITSLGDVAYFLALEDGGAKIYASRPGRDGADVLDVLPSPFRKPLLKITENPHYGRVPALFEMIVQEEMPVGLFGWEGALYLLSRTPARGATEWWLTRIDPGNGKNAAVTGTVRLETAADHLMVVPGDDHWALIEKGPAVSYRDQAVHRVITLPAEQLRAASWSRDLETARVAALCAELGSAS